MARDSGRGGAIRIESRVAGAHEPHPATGGTVCHAAAKADRGSGNTGGAGGWTPEKNGGGVELRKGYKQTGTFLPDRLRQRRCVPKPRAGARNERLPWETMPFHSQPQRGCGATAENRRNPVGVELITDIAPRVARGAQPWALG